MTIASRAAAALLVLLLGAGFAGAVPLTNPNQSLLPSAEKAGATGAERAYAEGILALAGKDLEAARQAFGRALKMRPNYANAMLGLAEVAFRNNDAEEASKLIGRAVLAEPRNAHARASLGRLQATRQQYTEAQASLSKAIELDARMIRPRMDLADLYATALKKPREALVLYRGVLAEQPGHSGARYALGVVLARLGELEPAREALEAAQAAEPGNPLPPLALSRVRAAAKDLPGALAAVDRALGIQPGLVEALEWRGDLHLLSGRREPALADYAFAAKAQPDSVVLLLKLGSLQQQLGRYDDAQQAYLAATRLNRRLAPAYNNLAWMALERKQDLARAESWARTAVEFGPEVSEFHDTLGWVLRARGDLKGAEAALLQATGQRRVPAEAHYHLGMVRKELGKKAEAELAFRKAIEIDKNHAGAASELR